MSTSCSSEGFAPCPVSGFCHCFPCAYSQDLPWLGYSGSSGTDRRRIVATSAIGGVFIAESAVIPLSLERFEDDPPEVYEWLRGQGGVSPIVELPYKRMDTRYMFWARHHGFRPMLNGDSGFIPQSHVWMREIFLRFPSADSLALLRSLEVSHAVVHLGAYRNNMRRLTRLLEDLKLYEEKLPTVASFGRDLVLGIEVEGEGQTENPTGTPLAIKRTGRLVDDNLDTIWHGEKERSTIEVVLREAAVINGLKLHYGRTPRIPVTRMKIEARDDSGQWMRFIGIALMIGRPLTAIVLSLLENPTDGLQVFTFDSVHTDALRLTLTGYEDEPEIAELKSSVASVPYQWIVA